MVNKDFLQALTNIAGKDNVIYSGNELLPYSHDETGGDNYRSLPLMAVMPGNTAEVAAVLKLAQKWRMPVTPRGGGTGLVGGAVPVRGGIVLSLARMNKVLEIDRGNMLVVTQPGVLTSSINERLSPLGLFYPGYPMSKESCTIGGNVATNAGGAWAVKYGVTRRYVLGLEAVLPGGAIIRTGGKRVKDATGYNLTGLLVGSEGTLAIVTEITLKALPLPAAGIDLLLTFPDLAAAGRFVHAVLVEAGIIPAAMELMDQSAVALSCRYLGESLPCNGKALLIIQLDGQSKEEVFASCEKIDKLGDKHGVNEIFCTLDPASSKLIWRIREAVPEAVRAIYPVQNGEDMVVPISAVPDFVTFLRELSKSYNCDVVCYGHAGDGNIHARFIKNDNQPVSLWRESLPRMLAEAYSKAASLGGTISGEHGIGLKRRNYLNAVLKPDDISLLQGIKKTFDPHDLLNPGKIFPDS